MPAAAFGRGRSRPDHLDCTAVAIASNPRATASLFHQREHFILTEEAALRVVAHIFGTIELPGPRRTSSESTVPRKADGIAAVCVRRPGESATIASMLSPNSSCAPTRGRRNRRHRSMKQRGCGPNRAGGTAVRSVSPPHFRQSVWHTHRASRRQLLRGAALMVTDLATALVQAVPAAANCRSWRCWPG